MNALVESRPMTALQHLALRLRADPQELMTTLKATAFKQKSGEPATDAQMAALTIVADQYGLNPFTKEIYAYPDKQNGIVPVVSVDGWARIINEHKALDGIEFRYSEEFETLPDGKPCPKWCEVVISRKDRSKPIVVREYLDEVYRAKLKITPKQGEPYSISTPWQSHTKRMLRHKTLIQGSRIAFGFAGIYDEDEAQRIVERDITPEGETLPPKQISRPQAKAETQRQSTETVATQTSGIGATGDGDNASKTVASSSASAAATNGDKPATEGMRKTIGNKLKALAAARGVEYLEVEKACLHAVKADSIDGMTLTSVNLALDWVTSEQQKKDEGGE